MSQREETIERLKKQAEEEETEEFEIGEDDVEPLTLADEEPKREYGPREYVVLSKASGNNWAELARIESASAEAAIKSLGQKLQDGGSYVAIPSRNWHPTVVKVEQPPPKFTFSTPS